METDYTGWQQNTDVRIIEHNGQHRYNPIRIQLNFHLLQPISILLNSRSGTVGGGGGTHPIQIDAVVNLIYGNNIYDLTQVFQ